MQNKIPVIFIILLFTAGLGSLLYPVVSSYLAKQSQSQVIRGYEEQTGRLDDAIKAGYKEEAQNYNERLKRDIILTDPFSEDAAEGSNEEYHSILNLDESGMMGFVEIPKIEVYLPVYHDTGKVILENGAGHLEQTSFPVGGTGTHAVLSAHSGLPNAKLFTDLSKLEVKDTFYIHILDEILAYEVDQIKVVTPQETKDLLIDRAEDYVTLVTCTPYGINSHRLLVRGRRVPYVEEEKEGIVRDREDTSVLFAYAALIPVVLLLLFLYRVRKRHGTKKE